MRQLQESKNYQNTSSTSKVTSKTILCILLNLFSVCNTFKFQATWISRWPHDSIYSSVLCECESHENIKEFIAISCHIKLYHKSQMQTLNASPKNKCDYHQMFASQQNDHDTSCETYFHAHQPNY